jgi:hypothetical protein
MSVLSLICNQLPGKPSHVPHQMLRTVHGSILLPMVFGEAGSKELTLMFASSTLMLPSSNCQSSLSSCYHKHESLKKWAHEQRIREIEHASFTPLVLLATGGVAKEATVFYKRLASCLAMKWDQSYSSTMSWLRCHLMFSLLRSAIQCIRGARSSCGHALKAPPPIDLAIAELHCIWTI